MLTLEVLIATWQPEGIERVEAMNLPRVKGVTYSVSWQLHGDAPVPQSLSERPDVKVWRLDRPGVSANRNNLLEHATADVLLMADDDLLYTPAQLQAVISTFAAHPELELAVFRYDSGDAKHYPDHEADLSPEPKGMWYSAVEIALRRRSGAGALRFDELYGPGAELLQAAEDERFVLEARKRGVRGRFFPITITTHPGVSTGLRPITNPGVASALGALIVEKWGAAQAILRLPLAAWRLSRSGRMALLPALGAILRGAIYICRRR